MESKGASEGEASDRRQAYYSLALLTAILGFNFVDGQALGLVLQDIKEAFRVSDTALGILTGIAFTLFYSTIGIPIGRWADRGNRVNIIVLSLGLRSLLVMVSGATQTFAEFLMVRIGVAVGEAGCLPPAFSLLSEYFSRGERPRALSIYYVGGQGVASVFGFFVGGLLSKWVGWRLMFVLLGLPGLVLMVIAKLTLVETRVTSRDQEGNRVRASGPPGLMDTWRALLRNRTFRHVTAMLCVMYFFGGGAGNWQPTFYIRSFGLTTLQVGSWFAFLSFGGAIGGYIGGQLASRYAPGKEPLQLKGMAVLCVVYGVLVSVGYLSHNANVSLGLITIAAIAIGAYGGPLAATSQTVVSDDMRAVSIAIQLLLCNLIGAGLGPLLVGMLSDAWQPILGKESLRYALVATCPGLLWCAWHLWRAAESVLADIAQTQEGSNRRPLRATVK